MYVCMYLWVCVCVCIMYVCMYVRNVCVWACVYVYACIYVCMYVMCVYVCTYVCVCVSVNVCVSHTIFKILLHNDRILKDLSHKRYSHLFILIYLNLFLKWRGFNCMHINEHPENNLLNT
jgi:hypothetical protein